MLHSDGQEWTKAGLHDLCKWANEQGPGASAIRVSSSFNIPLLFLESDSWCLSPAQRFPVEWVREEAHQHS
eukprot:scaffold119771_cov19-Tisochrysis_lutea.AAC.1